MGPHEPESDEESVPDDDDRLLQLMTFEGSPEEHAAFLHKLGGEDAIIYGDLHVGLEKTAVAFFLLNGAAKFNEERPVAPQIEENLALFKAAVSSEDKDLQAALLNMHELFCVKERRDGLQEAGKVLKVLWENDLVAEDVLEAWHANEQALREVCPKHWDQDDAISIRDSSREFIEWMQAGECGY